MSWKSHKTHKPRNPQLGTENWFSHPPRLVRVKQMSRPALAVRPRLATIGVRFPVESEIRARSHTEKTQVLGGRLLSSLARFLKKGWRRMTEENFKHSKNTYRQSFGAKKSKKKSGENISLDITGYNSSELGISPSPMPKASTSKSLIEAAQSRAVSGRKMTTAAEILESGHEFLTIEETAVIFRRSTQTIRKLIRKGRLPAFVVEDEMKIMMVRRDTILELLRHPNGQ